MDMHSMGEVIENMEWPGDEPNKKLTSTPVAEECVNCGALVTFVANQWRRTCPVCKMNITLSKQYKRPEKKVRCYGCYDSGIIIYQAQVDGEIYDYAARCICRAGTSHPSKGILFIDQAQNAPEYHAIVAKNKTRGKR